MKNFYILHTIYLFIVCHDLYLNVIVFVVLHIVVAGGVVVVATKWEAQNTRQTHRQADGRTKTYGQQQ